jgi:hypothetical protein
MSLSLLEKNHNILWIIAVNGGFHNLRHHRRGGFCVAAAQGIPAYHASPSAVARLCGDHRVNK